MMRYWMVVLVLLSQAALRPAASDELQPQVIPVYLFPPRWNPNSRQLATYVLSQPIIWRVGDRGRRSVPQTMPPSVSSGGFKTPPH